MKITSIAVTLAFSLALSGQAFAQDISFTKESQGPSMLILSSSGGQATNTFSVLHSELSDIPYGSKEGTITSISYVSTTYPASFGETAELCFYTAYTNNPLTCTAIIPGSEGDVTTFNGQHFQAGVTVKIFHAADSTGSIYFAQPAGEESITFNYTTN